MSLDMSLSRVSRCLPNSSSGQWRSRMNDCRASNFQKRSSDVPEPLLREQPQLNQCHSTNNTTMVKHSLWRLHGPLGRLQFTEACEPPVRGLEGQQIMKPQLHQRKLFCCIFGFLCCRMHNGPHICIDIHYLSSVILF